MSEFMTSKAWPVSWAIFVVLALIAPGASAAASTEPSIVSDVQTARSAPLPDFSHAGYGFGVKQIPKSHGKIILVTDHGAIPDDARDDSRAVIAALAAANQVKGPVTLRFPAGRFILSEILWIRRSHIVIEGAGRGAGGTELIFPRPLRMVDRSPALDKLRAYLATNDKRQVEPARNIDLPFSEYSWSGGFIWVQKPETMDDGGERKPQPNGAAVFGRQGQKTVRLGARGPWQVGDVVKLQWHARDGADSGIIASIYGKGVEVGSHHWTTPDRPLVVQTTRIETIRGVEMTIADPLLHDIGPSLPAMLVPWDGLTEVGVRDLALVFPVGASFGHHLEQGYNGIHLNDVFDGWIDSLRIANAESGILTDGSANLTIRNVVTEGERTAHYAVHIGDVHNVLVTGLLVANPVIHSLSFNTGSTRSVFQRATVLRSPTLDQHAGANHQNLFDNLTVHIEAKRDANGPVYPLWDGSGAPYWQPGHGRYNTSWNIMVIVESGALPSEAVRLTGLDEGPAARIVGIRGNRKFELDYRPTPYIERLNSEMREIPSLYDFQLRRRLPPR